MNKKIIIFHIKFALLFQEADWYDRVTHFTKVNLKILITGGVFLNLILNFHILISTFQKHFLIIFSK